MPSKRTLAIAGIATAFCSAVFLAHFSGYRAGRTRGVLDARVAFGELIQKSLHLQIMTQSLLRYADILERLGPAHATELQEVKELQAARLALQIHLANVQRTGVISSRLADMTPEERRDSQILLQAADEKFYRYCTRFTKLYYSLANQGLITGDDLKIPSQYLIMVEEPIFPKPTGVQEVTPPAAP